MEKVVDRCPLHPMTILVALFLVLTAAVFIAWGILIDQILLSVLAVVFVPPLFLLYPVRYEVDGTAFTARSGLLRRSVPLAEIERLCEVPPASRYTLSGYRPAGRRSRYVCVNPHLGMWRWITFTPSDAFLQVFLMRLGKDGLDPLPEAGPRDTDSGTAARPRAPKAALRRTPSDARKLPPSIGKRRGPSEIHGLAPRPPLAPTQSRTPSSPPRPST